MVFDFLPPIDDTFCKSIFEKKGYNYTAHRLTHFQVCVDSTTFNTSLPVFSPQAIVFFLPSALWQTHPDNEFAQTLCNCGEERKTRKQNNILKTYLISIA